MGTPFPLGDLERTVPGPGGGGVPGPTVVPELLGEDIALLYLQVDGAGSARNVYGLRASHYIEVRGKDGAVTSTGLYSFTGEDPLLLANIVDAAASGNELEVSVETNGIEGLSVSLVVLKGWDLDFDTGSPAPVQDLDGETRTGGPLGDPVPIPEFGEVAVPLAATLVVYSVIRRSRRSRKAVESPQTF